MASVPYRSDKPTHARVYNPPVVLPEDRAKRKRFYASSAWKTLRSIVLAENPLCPECLKQGKVEPAREVHHIRPMAEAPELALVKLNLIGLCKACHSRATAREKNDGSKA